MNKVIAGKNEYNRTFELSELVSAHYYRSSRPDKPYWERHNFSQIYVLLEGEGKYILDGTEYELSRGMMFYCPAEKDFMHIFGINYVLCLHWFDFGCLCYSRAS